ncbi:MAG: hypothetical protein LBH34_05350 [Prevotellaceae bacterium]|jgi:hypothetical protein|nr:hypothetical protein [Prevotellaceae bacterium]
MEKIAKARGYKVQKRLYYLTFKEVGWIDLLTRHRCCEAVKAHERGILFCLI